MYVVPDQSGRRIVVTGVEHGTEPLLFAIADPAAANGAYYGPRRWVAGPTKRVRLPLSARRADAVALFELAERLTGVGVPS